MKLKKRISIILAMSLLISTAAAADETSVFDDISINDEVYGAAQLLKNLGVVSGVGERKFAPDSALTRADFAVMIDKATGFKGVSENLYSDIPADSYYAGSVERISSAGIIRGDGDGNFNPYKIINKQEAAVILSKTYEIYKGSQIFAPNAAAEFSDYEEAAVWARPFLDKALLMELIKPESENAIGASDEFTRADAAIAIAKLIQKAGENRDYDVGNDKIIQWNRGNIFVGDETPGFTVNTGYEVIEYVLTDYWNNVLECTSVRIQNGSIDLSFENLKPGYYEVKIYSADHDGIKHEILKTSMCYFEEYNFMNVTDSPFGINMHCDRNFGGWTYDLIKEAEIMGAKHIRDQYEWETVEGTPKDYTRIQPTINNYCSLLKKHGMDMLLVTGFTNHLYDNGATPYTDAGRKAFADYSKSFYDLYDLIPVQEMYNEFWGFGDRGNGPADNLPEYYAPLLKTTYETIKAEHPEAILTFCLGDKNWSDELLSLGTLNYCDIIVTHNYGPAERNNQSLEDALRAEDAMKKAVVEKYSNGRKIEMWNTETGCNSSTNQYGNSEKSQAQFIPRIAAISFADDIKRVYYYDLLDDGNSDSEHEDRFGYLRAFGSKYGSYTPKPAYVSYGAMARALTGYELSDSRSFENGIEWYKFLKGTQELHMLHTRGVPAKEDLKDVIVYAKGDVEATDIMGGKKIYTPQDGKIYLTLSGDVLYLKGNITDIEEKEFITLKSDEKITVGSDFDITAESAAGADTDGISLAANGVEYQIGQPMKFHGFYEAANGTIFADIIKDGKICGTLRKIVTAQDIYNAEIDAGVTLSKDTNKFNSYIELTVTNHDLKDITVNSALLDIDGEKIEKIVETQIAPDETKKLKLEIGEARLGESHEISARLCVNYVLSDVIDAQKNVQYNAIHKQSISIDGVIDDDLRRIKPLTIEKDGERFGLAADGSIFKGDKDFSGNVWITYDENCFYVSAEVIDDEHSSPSASEEIWKNDSMQIDFYQHETKNLYSGSLGYTEFGISLLNDSTVGLWTWNAVKDLGEPSKPNGVKAAVVRDEAKKTTVYEASVNWEEAGGINFEDISRIDISVAFNDCDNGVRQTGFEIGGGVIYGKDPSKYNKYCLVE